MTYYKEYQKQWRTEHREQILEYHKQYNKEYHKKTYPKNKERILEYCRQYRLRPEVKERERLRQQRRYAEVKKNGVWTIA